MATRRPAQATGRTPGIAGAPAVREPASTQLRALRRKYDELHAKHRALVRRATAAAAGRAGITTLALFALDVSESALATTDGEHVLFRNPRWHVLERERTAWTASARDPVAPASAPTLLHLAIDAGSALLARGAPPTASARYHRPDRGDHFDVRFERLAERRAVGIAVRDVTRLVLAERELAAARAALELRDGPPPVARATGRAAAHRATG